MKRHVIIFSFLLVPVFTSSLSAHPVISLGFGSLNVPTTKSSLFLEEEQVKYKFSYTQNCAGILYNGSYQSDLLWTPFNTDGWVGMLSAGSTLDWVLSSQFKLRIGIPLIYTHEYRTRLGTYGSYVPLEFKDADVAGGWITPDNTPDISNSSVGLGDLRITGLTLAVMETVNSPAIIVTNGMVVPTGRFVTELYQRETTTGGGNLNLVTGLTIAKTFTPVSLIATVNYELGIVTRELPKLKIEKAGGGVITLGEGVRFNNILSFAFGVNMPVLYVEEQKEVPQIEGWTGPDTFTVKRPVINAGLILQSTEFTYSIEGVSSTKYYREHKTKFGPLMEIRPGSQYSIMAVLLLDLPSLQRSTQSDVRMNLSFTYYFLEKK